MDWTLEALRTVIQLHFSISAVSLADVYKINSIWGNTKGVPPELRVPLHRTSTE